MLFILLIVSILAGIAGCADYFIEGRIVVNGAPTYASHQVRIYPRLIPAGPLLFVVTMIMAQQEKNSVMLTAAIVCFFLNLVLLVVFTFLLHLGREKIKAVPNGTVVCAKENFKAIRSDLSGKSFSGKVTLDGKSYRAYQLLRSGRKPAKSGDLLTVSDNDNFHLVVRRLKSGKTASDKETK